MTKSLKTRKMSKTIFVTVGTTKFDLLIKTICERDILEKLKNLGYFKIIMQIGNGQTIPVSTVKDVEIEYYRFKNSLKNDISNASLVISHAGAGSCLEVLDDGKPLIVVVNENLMDNHQLELAQQLYKNGHLLYCTCSTLSNTLNNLNVKSFKPFPQGSTNEFIEYLNVVCGFRR